MPHNATVHAALIKGPPFLKMHNINLNMVVSGQHAYNDIRTPVVEKYSLSRKSKQTSQYALITEVIWVGFRNSATVRVVRNEAIVGHVPWEYYSKLLWFFICDCILENCLFTHIS